MGVQPKVGGKLHLKPNSGTRPIANKYHEGKVKSTLERELKRPRNRWEGNACSRTGPRRVHGAAVSRVCRRHRKGRRWARALGTPALSVLRAGQARRDPGDELGRAGNAAAWRRRTYSRPSGASGTRRGERWHFHPSSAGRSSAGALWLVGEPLRVTACSGRGRSASGSGVAHSLRSGRLA